MGLPRTWGVVRILITDRKNPPLEMQAMVRRVIPEQGMTVEFVGMSDEMRRRLRNLVDVNAKTDEKLRLLSAAHSRSSN